MEGHNKVQMVAFQAIYTRNYTNLEKNEQKRKIGGGHNKGIPLATIRSGSVDAAG